MVLRAILTTEEGLHLSKAAAEIIDKQTSTTDRIGTTWRRTSQRDVELMTKEKVLGFKPRLEQVGDEHSERV